MIMQSLYLDREMTSSTSRPSIHAPNIIGKQGKILTTLYTPGSGKARPVIIIALGLPGHEKNIDLAQALRRIGFNVIIYYYSGCWGSEGGFSFKNSIDDTHAILDFVLDDQEYNFDKRNIFFLGHSLGCFAASKVMTRPEIKAGIFLMPCDFGKLYEFSKIDENAKNFVTELLEECAQLLNGTDRLKLIEEIEENQDYYSFDAMIDILADKPILWISGKNDEFVPEGLHTIPFMDKLRDYPQHKIVWRSLNTDHYFSDIRIQLSYEIANFLSGLLEERSVPKLEQATFVDELQQLLAREYKTITLSDAAAYFNLSVSYLSKLIHEKTAKSFTSLLADLKMEKARELLLDTNLSINEIAECLGYNDATYFMKSFKKHYNCTPTVYRNTCRQTE